MTETVFQIDTGNFTNVFLIRGDGGSILVDTGNPGKADHILNRLAERGVAPSDICLPTGTLTTLAARRNCGSAPAHRSPSTRWTPTPCGRASTSLTVSTRRAG